MRVIEKFIGIEGEGLWTGLPVVTIRLAGCNLKCPECDTSYSWGAGEEVPIEEIMTFIVDSKIENVSLTGGEPLYRPGKEFEELKQFLSLLSNDYFVKVETNGTITPCETLQEAVHFWSVSPKMGGLGGVFDVKVLKTFANIWNVTKQNVQFKFVVDVDKHGLETIKTIFKNSGLGSELTGSYIPVVFHPVAKLNDPLEEYRRKYAVLIEKVLADLDYWKEFNVRIMLQSHKIAFGDAKGK